MKPYLVLLIALMLLLGGCGTELPREEAATPYEQTLAYLLEKPAPGYGSVGGEWLMLAMIRSGEILPEGYKEAYLQDLAAEVAEAEGILDPRKYTEYSRVVLTLSAMGEDPFSVEGYDLVAPLYDTERVTAQGVNGGAFAILALRSVGVQGDVINSYVDFLLAEQLADGGWALTGDQGQADLTAMALTALASCEEAAAAIEQGLAFLSDAQEENGGWEMNSESCSQVLIAMDALGIPLDDPAFVKEENTVYDALLSYQNGDGGFAHLSGGESDQMATEQAFLALVAYETEESIY